MLCRPSILLAVATIWLAGGGCASQQPKPSAAPPPIPPGGGAPLLADEAVAAARKLYIVKCANCHRFYPPADYSASEWDSWMKKMSRKARLKSTEEESLREYLSLFRR